MAKLNEMIIKFEVEVKIYKIVPVKKYWWNFWSSKHKRILINDLAEILIEKTGE